MEMRYGVFLRCKTTIGGYKMDYKKESLKLHEQWRGKVEVTARAKVDSSEALSLAYTPGVAQPCLEIQKDYSKSWELTRRWNRGRYARYGGQMRAV